MEATRDGSLNGVQGYATEGTSFFDNIDTLLGDPSVDWIIGNTTAENETYHGDFTHTLTVSGFEQMRAQYRGVFQRRIAGLDGRGTRRGGRPTSPSR